MNLESFSENFELLTDAPNAVVKLRKIILQLAVRGKLVPQDPDGEPVSYLLEEIDKEQGRLLVDEVSKQEERFNVPDSWQWIYLERISTKIHYGYTASANHELLDVRLLRITDIQDNRVNWESVPGCEISSDDLEKFKLQNGDLLIARTGGTIGKSFLVESISLNAVFASYLIRVVLCNQAFSKYIKLFLDSPLYWEQLYAKSMGTGQPNVNATSLKSLIVPLPPIAEQKRIVAKVDRLLILCDEIEKRQQQRQETIVKMNESAVAQLLSSQNPDDFRQHWQRICNNFDLLYSIPETIPKLRQAILQLAVQGKLVPQDPNDEPAMLLLEKIKFERKDLAKKDKIAKLQNFPPISSDKFPYQLPESWLWIPLGEMLVFGPRNGYSPKPVDYPTKIKTLTLSATTSGQFKSECFKYIDEEIEVESHLWLEKGDILMQRANTIEYVGIAAVYQGSSRGEYIYPDLMMKLRCSKFLEIGYLHIAINSEKSRNFLRTRATGTSSNMPKINQTTVNNLPIPLPPLAEQKRIVAKVDRLMSLCDELEGKLKEVRSHNEKLMEVAAREVLAV